MKNPILELIELQGYLVLDGGLATELEARGHSLDDELWSARLLMDEPDAIRQLHLDYLRAGADCIITSSYQASLRAFARRGIGPRERSALLRRSIELALEARELFLVEKDATRLRPLVAASVGPYGAYLADGSEYRGDYDLDEAGLRAFHAERWPILARGGADLLACETIPSLPEAAALLSLLDETPGAWAWLSFSCSDGEHLNDGTPIEEAVRLCDGVSRVSAVGVNCTAPMYVAELIERARAATDKLILAYPNLGEAYDASEKRWVPGTPVVSWSEQISHWAEAGARGLGGCCRTGPAQITATRAVLARLDLL